MVLATGFAGLLPDDGADAVGLEVLDEPPLLDWLDDFEEDEQHLPDEPLDFELEDDEDERDEEDEELDREEDDEELPKPASAGLAERVKISARVTVRRFMI